MFSLILAEGSLVKLGCIYDNGDGLKFCEDPDKAPKEANIVVGAIVKIPPIEEDAGKQVCRFVPGHMVGTLFTPGQKVSSDNGEFIPAACGNQNLLLHFAFKLQSKLNNHNVYT